MSTCNIKENVYKIEKDPQNRNKARIWFKNGFLYKGEIYKNDLSGNGLLLLGDGSYYSGKRFKSNFQAFSKKIHF